MANFFDRKGVADNWVGGKQDDTMNGNGGNDIIHGGGGNDSIYGGDGNDQLFGDDGNDFLSGGNGIDIVGGGAGNDTIYGNAGGDMLSGGLGADTFVYNYQADSNATTGIDTITDFNPAEGDKLNISGTEEGYSFNQAFVTQLVANASQITNDHQQATLTYDATRNVTTLNLYYGDGDPAIDMTVYIGGNHTTIDGLVGFYL